MSYSRQAFDTGDVVKIDKDFFEIQNILGAGGFGQVFHVMSIRTSENFAMKIELIKKNAPQLAIEEKMLHRLRNCEGVCKLITAGSTPNMRILIMELMGPSIEDLFIYCGEIFTLKTTLMLIYQMLNILENIHSYLIVSRDVKISNFLMGTGKKSHLVHICDFGLSKCFRNHSTLAYNVKPPNLSIRGTLRYMSVNIHHGWEPARRDDLISLMYNAIQMLTGSLPWSHTANEKNSPFRVYVIKRDYEERIDVLNIPREFKNILQHNFKVEMEGRPDYEYCRAQLRQCMLNNKIAFDYDYDWYHTDGTKQ